MDRSSLVPSPVREADLIVFDGDDARLLLVEVKIRVKSPAVVEILQQQIRDFDFPFGMVVDQDLIQIFGRNSALRVLELPTAPVFNFYDPNFSKNRLFVDYLQSLTAGWLADFGIAWKSEKPPYAQDLGEVGLAARLVGCTIDVDRQLGDGPPVSRNQFSDELRHWS